MDMLVSALGPTVVNRVLNYGVNASSRISAEDSSEPVETVSSGEPSMPEHGSTSANLDQLSEHGNILQPSECGNIDKPSKSINLAQPCGIVDVFQPSECIKVGSSIQPSRGVDAIDENLTNTSEGAMVTNDIKFSDSVDTINGPIPSDGQSVALSAFTNMGAPSATAPDSAVITHEAIAPTDLKRRHQADRPPALGSAPPCAPKVAKRRASETVAEARRGLSVPAAEVSADHRGDAAGV